MHRQSIKDLAPNFRATAFDPRDHTIEAIEAVDGHRIMGLQWHPEYLVNEEKGNLELFRYLLQNCKKKRGWTGTNLLWYGYYYLEIVRGFVTRIGTTIGRY